MIYVALACLCLTLLACGRPAEGREQRDFERMRQQQRYDSYEPSAFFANRAELQAPPAHTIPWSADTSLAATVPGFLTGSDNGTDLAALPIAPEQATLARGAEQFSISCAPCHGAGGYGAGIVGVNLPGGAPPSLRAPQIAALAPGTIFKVITNGFGRMPPHGWQMPPELRWAVVAYVKSLGRTPSTPATRADSTRAALLQRLDSARSLDARLAVMRAATGRNK
ncbi:MAG TPA: cytochrome c [Gemmatimonadaceae bacterium]|nr:cytochrome c [Gemmatimonadaceae bacterium]